MRVIILNVSAPDFMMGESFDYAVVIAGAQFAEDYIAHINKAKKLKEEDSDFKAATWWDYAPYFINAEGITDEEQEILCDEGYLLAHKPDDFVKDRGSRVDCCWVVADNEGVHWRAIPKHTDAYVDTRELPLMFLEKLQKGEL